MVSKGAIFEKECKKGLFKLALKKYPSKASYINLKVWR